MELDTALTDYLLCVEALLFLVFLRRRCPASRARTMSELLFATLATASLLGGLSHSLLSEERSGMFALVWTSTMLAIGGIGWSSWNLGAAFLTSRWKQPVAIASTIAFGIYAAVVLFVSQRYLIAIGHYLIGAVFLLASLASLLRKRAGGAGWAFSGVLLSVLAPLPHLLDYSPLPDELSPNATYHLLQAFALTLIYFGLTSLLNGRASRTASPESQEGR